MNKRLFYYVISVLTIFGVFNIMGPNEVSAAEQIGYVDVQKVFKSYPGIQSAIAVIDLERQKVQTEFIEQSAGLDDKDKAVLNKKLLEQITNKEKEMLGPIQKKISEAIIRVANEHAIDTVLDSGIIIFGSKDLTEEVLIEVAK